MKRSEGIRGRTNRNRKGEHLTVGHTVNEAIREAGLTPRDEEKLRKASFPRHPDRSAEDLSE